MFVIESHWRLSGLKNDTRMANTKTNIVLVSGIFVTKKFAKFYIICSNLSVTRSHGFHSDIAPEKYHESVTNRGYVSTSSLFTFFYFLFLIRDQMRLS